MAYAASAKKSDVDIDQLYDLNKADELFNNFVNQYEKVYKNVKDKNKHFRAFQKCLKIINKENVKGNVEEINEYCDYTLKEMKKLLLKSKTKTEDQNKTDEDVNKTVEDENKTAENKNKPTENENKTTENDNKTAEDVNITDENQNEIDMNQIEIIEKTDWINYRPFLEKYGHPGKAYYSNPKDYYLKIFEKYGYPDKPYYTDPNGYTFYKSLNYS